MTALGHEADISTVNSAVQRSPVLSFTTEIQNNSGLPKDLPALLQQADRGKNGPAAGPGEWEEE